MIQDFPPLDVLSVLFWLSLIGLLGVAVAFALLAGVRKLPHAIWVSAATLLMALLLALGATTAWWSAGWAPAGGATGVVIALLGIALAVFGGGPAAQLALELATRGSVVAGSHGGILVSAAAMPGTTPGSAGAAADTETGPRAANGPAPVAGTREVLRGGAAIGVLERLCVVLGIMVGFPEALAVIVAVKGLGRFTELAAAEARERFIIGSLASLLWASACAVLIRLALA